jgi:murein DD-endopeptidase MepM/ murein hydrolase activator NlpD
MERRKTHRSLPSYGVKRPAAANLFASFFCGLGFSIALSLASPHLAIAEKSPTADTLLSSTAQAKTSASALLTLRGIVEKGETVLSIFRQAGIDISQVMALYQAVREVYDLHRLDIGQPYHIHFSPEGQLQTFIYDIDAQKRLEAVRQDQTFTGRIELIPYKPRERVIAGDITDTIYAALTAQGESARLINDFSEIFAWSIDFATDLQPSDSYRLLVEEHQHEGQSPQYHRILAAELVNRNRAMQTVYYQHDKIEGYYQPDGRSMRGMFLRSPLRYTRISSGYSQRRLHPILKHYRPHRGIDFAAPVGTPVHSIGDGKIVWIGRKGPNGNMIKIQHNETYASYYLHLARYAKDVHAGARVQQGQVIGYVGSTGLSTGPHLDFRMTKNGEYINPLQPQNLSAPPLPEMVLAQFRLYSKDILKKLDQVQRAMQPDANPDWQKSDAGSKTVSATVSAQLSEEPVAVHATYQASSGDWRAAQIGTTPEPRSDQLLALSRQPSNPEVASKLERRVSLPLQPRLEQQPEILDQTPNSGLTQRVVDLMRHHFPNGGAFPLRVWVNKGSKEMYTEGENLLVHVLSEQNAHLQMDYYQADGQVVHLLPHPLDNNQVEAGEIFSWGKPDNTFQFKVVPPFGVEMLAVVASRSPLDASQGGPTIELATQYLERLGKRLETYKAQGHAAIAHVRIRTRQSP